jgi:hypothetical protein
MAQTEALLLSEKTPFVFMMLTPIPDLSSRRHGPVA